MRWLKNAWKPAEVVALFATAGLLAYGTGFAFRCDLEEHQMTRLMRFSQHRQQVCLELGWRWEADDQENQYKPWTSAGTTSTVGPISGFVMDVTENEFGHTEGQCHAASASYKDLLTRY